MSTLTQSEDQKPNSVVFEVSASELKTNYKLCLSEEKTIRGKIFRIKTFFLFKLNKINFKLT